MGNSKVIKAHDRFVNMVVGLIFIIIIKKQLKITDGFRTNVQIGDIINGDYTSKSIAKDERSLYRHDDGSGAFAVLYRLARAMVNDAKNR